MSDHFPPDLRADLQAVLDHVASGKPLDPEVARRVSERSTAVQEELVRRFGVREIAVDLQPFGLDNPNEVFVATDQPYGLIEATIRRGTA